MKETGVLEIKHYLHEAVRHLSNELMFQSGEAVYSRNNALYYIRGIMRSYTESERGWAFDRTG